MKEGQRLWTKEELILAINLYCKLPFGKMHKGNNEIIELATLINRSPSSVARKLGNFASFDPSLQARGIKGLTGTSKLDAEVWNEFYNDWDLRLMESEKLLASFKSSTLEKLHGIHSNDLFKEGKERESVIRARVNQSIFRRMILAAYKNTCCITGIKNPELLIASHIVQWSKDTRNRLNPMNGLALNALHDRAFENGLITVDAVNYEVRVSTKLLKSNNVAMKTYFENYERKQILLPDKFLPGKDFLRKHNEEKFIQ